MSQLKLLEMGCSTMVMQVLDIDLSWRMHKASDGQRRRIQICMGLLKPFKVCHLCA